MVAIVKKRLCLNLAQRFMKLVFLLLSFWFSAAFACDEASFLPKFSYLLEKDQGVFFEVAPYRNDESEYSLVIYHRETRAIILDIVVDRQTQALSLTVKSRDKLGQRFREDFNGTTLLDYVFEKLSSDGIPVKTVKTNWSEAVGLNANLVEFNVLTARFADNPNGLTKDELNKLLVYEKSRRKSEESPDLRPWTLRALEKFGFTNYQVTLAMGWPGSYKKVMINVTRPDAKPITELLELPSSNLSETVAKFETKNKILNRYQYQLKYKYPSGRSVDLIDLTYDGVSKEISMALMRTRNADGTLIHKDVTGRALLEHAINHLRSNDLDVNSFVTSWSDENSGFTTNIDQLNALLGSSSNLGKEGVLAILNSTANETPEQLPWSLRALRELGFTHYSIEGLIFENGRYNFASVRASLP